MTLIDAIKSGKKFRRKGREEWQTTYFLETTLGRYSDALADDWEIQEPSVTITRTQFYEAFGSCFGSQRPNQTMPTDLANELARKLGLESK